MNKQPLLPENGGLRSLAFRRVGTWVMMLWFAPLGLLPASAQFVLGTAQEAGLLSRFSSVDVNPRSEGNNGNVTELSLAITANGRIVVSASDPGNGVTSFDAFYTTFSLDGVRLTPLRTIQSAEGPSLNTRFRGFSRSDGVPVVMNVAIDPLVSANEVDGGFLFMGTISEFADAELPELAELLAAGALPIAQRFSDTGEVTGFFPGRAFREPSLFEESSIAGGAVLANGNVVILNRIVLDEGDVQIPRLSYRVLNGSGLQLRAEELVSGGSDSSDALRGLAALPRGNGFAVRFSGGDGRAKLRLFDNAGQPRSSDIDLGQITGRPAAALDGDGRRGGFQSNGRDAYVLSTPAPEGGILVTVLTSAGAVRYSVHLAGPVVSSVDAAIGTDGRVVAVFTVPLDGRPSVVAGRLKADGELQGGLFLVSEGRAGSLGEGTPAVSLSGDDIAIAWRTTGPAPTDLPTIKLQAFRESPLPEPPRIAVQDEDRAVLVGSPLSLTVKVEGTPPFTYRWFKNGQEIPGARLPTFSVVSSRFQDSGAYQALVLNAQGEARTTLVLVNVHADRPALSSVPEMDPAQYPGHLLLVVRNALGLLTAERSEDMVHWLEATSVYGRGDRTILPVPLSGDSQSSFYRVRQEPDPGQGESVMLSARDDLFIYREGLVPGQTLVLWDEEGREVARGKAKPDGTLSLNADLRQQPADTHLVLHTVDNVGSGNLPERIRVSKGDDAPKGAPIEYQLNNQPFRDGMTCECADCPKERMMVGGVGMWAQSESVDLHNGSSRSEVMKITVPGAVLDVTLSLVAVSGVQSAGTFGPNIIFGPEVTGVLQDSAIAARLFTKQGRLVNLKLLNNLWKPDSDGVWSQFHLDEEAGCWEAVTVGGERAVYSAPGVGKLGRLLSESDSNGNRTTYRRDGEGNLTTIRMDDGKQIQFNYTGAEPGVAASAGRNLPGGPPPFQTRLVDHIVDPLGRIVRFHYRSDVGLFRIELPETEYVNLAPGEEVIDTTLASKLVRRTRSRYLDYEDPRFPRIATSMKDDRGALVWGKELDDLGRVVGVRINNGTIRYQYDLPPSGPSPRPLPVLENGNMITRVTDRVGNIVDHEILGAAQLNALGLRRRVTWTHSGRGLPALRQGEPLYYEQRWTYLCNCLLPAIETQPFSNLDTNGFHYGIAAMPTNYPHSIMTYTGFGQVATNWYTDGTSRIVKSWAYQAGGHGSGGQFAKPIAIVDPRQHDPNPIYAGLNFVTRLFYDLRGNLTNKTMPTVTLGVDKPQVIVDSWRVDSRGREVEHIDPNGNIGRREYYRGPISGGDIDTAGEFGEFLKSVTIGDIGSRDPETRIKTTYRVNALGWVTAVIDPMGHRTDVRYNALGEQIQESLPQVTLRNGLKVRYEKLDYYDGAGNKVMSRTKNIDYDGTLLPNEYVDHSWSYDAGNNVLSQRLEVDNHDTNDLVTRFGYDLNEQRIVTVKPERNRLFEIPDERGLHFKKFYGISPGASILEGYPVDKRATDLSGVSFVGYTIQSYDSRGNPVVRRDGRGYLSLAFYDFKNRLVATSDANGNGETKSYDAASKMLDVAEGEISRVSGAITLPLSRSYRRYDEAGRLYETTLDGDLNTDERSDVTPYRLSSATRRSMFDARSRLVQAVDANGNPTTFGYDAANRRVAATDPLGNAMRDDYDDDSNVVASERIEKPGPGAVGNPEVYVTTYRHDELNRRIAMHEQGLNGDSIDHVTRFSFDSRGNIRVVVDAETNSVVMAYDDEDRLIGNYRHSGDPMTGTSELLQRIEHEYDRNSSKVTEIAYSKVSDASSAQVTRYGFDHADRLVREVYPDSDDPIDGRGNGPDNQYDRIERRYDKESNLIGMEDQRGASVTNIYDPGNRLTDQYIGTPLSTPGTDRQSFAWDQKNRLTSACNNYTRVSMEFDSHSRRIRESQSVNVSGAGFIEGWSEPIDVMSAFDAQSNRTNCSVLAGSTSDLVIASQFDTGNRVTRIRAKYFNSEDREVVSYTYFGPDRVQVRRLRNGCLLTNSYDSRARVASMVWRDASGALLAGFEYGGYDLQDNLGYERVLHDKGAYTVYAYDDLYQLTSCEYRSPTIVSRTPQSRFSYDALHNRTDALIGDPFGLQVGTADTYEANRANEYAIMTRNGLARAVRYDAAGNMLQMPVAVRKGGGEQSEATATAQYDALNCMVRVETSQGSVSHYRYDAFRRRVICLKGNGPGDHTYRRFIYSGWQEVEERMAPVGSTNTMVERINVFGTRLDEHLLVAIDADRDGALVHNSLKNIADPRADKEYFILQDRLGSTVALLDADNAARVLEYYSYAAFGQATVMEAVDDNRDGVEDTPGDLSDNYRLKKLQFSKNYENHYAYSGTRLDHESGLNFARHRYLETLMGRFTQRDPIGYAGGPNLYVFVRNRVSNRVDPMGLQEAPQPARGHASATGDVYEHDSDAWLYPGLLLSPFTGGLSAALGGFLAWDSSLGELGVDVDFSVADCSIDLSSVTVSDRVGGRVSEGRKVAIKTVMTPGSQVDCECKPCPKKKARCLAFTVQYEIGGPDETYTEKVSMKASGKASRGATAGGEMEGVKAGLSQSGDASADFSYEWGRSFTNPGAVHRGSMSFEVCPTGCNTASQSKIERRNPRESTKIGGDDIIVR